MLALVEIGGVQFEVEPDKNLNVPLLGGEPGDMVEFSNILMTQDGDNTTIGSPYIEGKVSAKILSHGKGDKVIVFHKKRRKGHRKLNGHRERYSAIEITGINLQ